MGKFTLDVPDDVLDEFDRYTKAHGYLTRASAIRQAMLDFLKKLKEES